MPSPIRPGAGSGTLVLPVASGLFRPESLTPRPDSSPHLSPPAGDEPPAPGSAQSAGASPRVHHRLISFVFSHYLYDPAEVLVALRLPVSDGSLLAAESSDPAEPEDAGAEMSIC